MADWTYDLVDTDSPELQWETEQLTGNVVVVGAGIAGLFSCLLLERLGWNVQLVERRSRANGEGGGIALTPNGLAALNVAGVSREVQSAGETQESGGVRTPAGRWLAQSDLSFVEGRYGYPIVSLLREDLIEILEDNLQSTCVRYGARAELKEPGSVGRPALLKVNDDLVAADLVIAADGINSAMRQKVEGEVVRAPKFVAASWRGIVPLESGSSIPTAETWGKLERFSILPLPQGLAHFSALSYRPAAVATSQRSDLLGLMALYHDWHEPIPQLLARVQDTNIHIGKVMEWGPPPARLDRGRVALVGDAAHPMLPNLGAASIGLEDCVHLVGALDRIPHDIPRALSDYSRGRGPRLRRLTRLSRHTDRFITSRVGCATGIRSGAVVLGGKFEKITAAGSMDRFCSWQPPLPPLKTTNGTMA